jgi:hypothetical protein
MAWAAAHNASALAAVWITLMRENPAMAFGRFALTGCVRSIMRLSLNLEVGRASTGY